MYSIERLNSIRALELYLFGGISPTICDRYERRYEPAQKEDSHTEEGTVVTGRLEFDLKTGKMSIIDYPTPKTIESKVSSPTSK